MPTEEDDSVRGDGGDVRGDGDAGEPSGRRWLKYAGVGGPRQSAAVERLHGEGITSLGSLEAEVMGVLWEIGRPATGMEVMERSLYKRRSQGEEPASFATIATTLRRLTQKGLLTSQKNAQRTPVYAPTVEREAMAARILNNVSQTLLGQPLDALLPKLVGILARSLAGTPKGGKGGGKARRAAEGDPEADAVQRLIAALEAVALDEQEGRGGEGS